MITIARYEALKHRRRMTRSPRVFAEDVWELLSDESSDAEFGEIRQEHLEACLQKLDPKKREILLKVHTPGVVMREVAEQSGQSEQAFYKAIQRLRASLLECVTRSMAAEGQS